MWKIFFSRSLVAADSYVLFLYMYKNSRTNFFCHAFDNVWTWNENILDVDHLCWWVFFMSNLKTNLIAIKRIFYNSLSLFFFFLNIIFFSTLLLTNKKISLRYDFLFSEFFFNFKGLCLIVPMLLWFCETKGHGIRQIGYF